MDLKREVVGQEGKIYYVCRRMGGWEDGWDRQDLTDAERAKCIGINGEHTRGVRVWCAVEQVWVVRGRGVSTA